MLVVLDGSLWVIDPALFGDDARLSISSTGNTHILRLTDARLPGATLDLRMSTKIYLREARWRMRLRASALRIDHDVLLTAWIGRRARVEGRPTALALQLADGMRLTSPRGGSRFSMDADWCFEAASVRGEQRLLAEGVDLALGRIRLRPSLNIDAHSIAGVADGERRSGPVTRVEAELRDGQPVELGSSANGSVVSVLWNPATRLTLESWGRAFDGRAALLLTGHGTLRVAAPDMRAEPLQMPLDDSAMAIGLGAQRDALIAARLRRSAFAVDTGETVLTLAARDDEPQLLRFRDGRAGPLHLKAEMLQAHMPVLDADRGSVEFAAVPIDIIDSAPEIPSPPPLVSQSDADARVVLVGDLPTPIPPVPACKAPSDDARGLLVIGGRERMFLAPLDKGRLRVHRSLDLFHLEFGFCNYRVRVIRGRAWLEPYLASIPCNPETQHHRLIVHFPAQNLAEQAFPLQEDCAPGTGGEQCVPTHPPPAPDASMAEARRSGPTRLVFEIAPGSPDAKAKRLSVETLTEWSDMALAVNKRAMAPDMSVEDQLQAIGITEHTDRDNAMLKIIQYVTPPTPDETAIEAVFRLQMSPTADACFKTPRVAPQRSGGEKWKADALLWHARLDPASGGDTMRVLWSRDDDLAWTFNPKKDPNWPDGKRPWDSPRDPGFLLSLTEAQRMQLVLLTSIPGLPALRALVRDSAGNPIPAPPKPGYPVSRVRAPNTKFDYLDYGAQEGVFSPQPVSVTLLLTALGSNLDVNFEIEPPATSPPPAGKRAPWRTADVELWQHKARLGRDMYVKILEKGFALPLGHRTAYVSLTERKFAKRRDEHGNETNEVAAFLFQRHFTISRPIKTFPGYAQPFAGLDFPVVKNITLLNPTSPDLAPPDYLVPESQGKVFWIRTQKGDGRSGCAIFEWTIDDNPAPVRGPLMFVDNQAVHDPDTMKQVVGIYRGLTEKNGRSELRIADHGGTSRRYAEAAHEGDTTYDTADWLLSVRGRLLPDASGVLQEDFSMDGFMEGEDQPPFYPITESARVKVQTLDRLVGKPQGMIKVRFNPTYVESGFDHGRNPSEIYLDVISPEINLNVASDGASSGGVAKPNTRVAAISRANGLIGGRVLAPNGSGAGKHLAAPAGPPPGANSEAPAADFTAALSGRFDPIEYFGGAVAEAKLLGIVPLKDVLVSSPWQRRRTSRRPWLMVPTPRPTRSLGRRAPQFTRSATRWCRPSPKSRTRRPRLSTACSPAAGTGARSIRTSPPVCPISWLSFNVPLPWPTQHKARAASRRSSAKPAP